MPAGCRDITVLGGDGDGKAGRRVLPLWVALGLALALVLGVRLLPIGSVFRGSDVVLLSNDPYFYRYLVERAVTDGAVWRLDFGWFGGAEPLFVFTLAIVSTLLGGAERVGLVLAWYPVVTAVVSGLLVFLLARTLTDDARIGLAAVVVLAVTPLHASRTTLGFADHHAFDYLWLLLTATAFTWLVVRTEVARRQRWKVGAVLGVAVAAQTLTWRASPLMLAPVVGALGVSSLVVVRTDSPARTLAPLVAGLGLAAALSQLVHHAIGWQSTLVAATPVLLFLGGGVVLVLTELVGRADRSWPSLLGVELTAAVLLLLVLSALVPGFVGEMSGAVDAFGVYVERLGESGIGETAGLAAAFGPIAGPVVLLGFGPFLGLPATVWGVVRGWRRRDPGWVVLAVYVLWFLALSFLQRRFAVQLGLFLAVFAGVGFISLAHRLGLVLPPVSLRDDPSDTNQATLESPDRTRLALLAGIGAVGIGSGALFARFIQSDVSVDGAAYQAAAWMRGLAADRGWRYPRNYVLAHWDRARMYNYFVNGEGRSYAYARENYSDFIFSTDADRWYQQFGGQVGFVVTREREGTRPFHVQARLHERYGSAAAGARGVGHYRAVWESADGSVKVFTVVPGARVAGQAAPGTELVLSTTVTLAGTGATVEYSRRVETDEDGRFSTVLAHPGEYSVTGGGTLRVGKTAVAEGRQITLRL
jgi:asparagine N-glycosylation enzyme membrane subunit Stt3